MSDTYNQLMLDELNYNSYLKLPELLNLQKELSSPPHHDEMFFIIIHQTAELWFKEILHESGTLVQSLREHSVSHALKALKRIKAIMGLQIQQIRLLATLTPVEFAGFRSALGPASGFQSEQYRVIEFTYGLRNTFFLKFFKKMPAVKQKLERIQASPSVHDELIASLHQAGYKVPGHLLKRDYSQPWELDEALVNTIVSIYEQPKDLYHWVLLFEAMLDLDESFTLWRKTHAVMVARTIGHKQGTGGSAGFNFLQGRENLKCFPELWEARNRIGEGGRY